MRGLAILGASVMLMANTAPGTSVGYMTASALADRCREDSNVSVSYCLAFIAGVRDTAKAFEIWNGQREFCMPVTTTQSELRDGLFADAPITICRHGKGRPHR